MNSTIAVVIPHYNDVDSIHEAISSVNLQTRPVHEIIIVDDCSTTENVQSLQNICRLYRNIKLICLSKNAGPSHARNVGIDAANSDFVAILDSDDTWHPDKLRLQLDVFTKYPNTSMIGSGVKYLNRSQNFVHDERVLSEHKVSMRQILTKNLFATSSIIFQAPVKLKFCEDMRYAEDYYLFLQTVATSDVRLIKNNLVYRYKSPVGDSGLSSHVWKMLLSESELFYKLYTYNYIKFPELLFGQFMFFIRAIRRIGKYAIQKAKK